MKIIKYLFYIVLITASTIGCGEADYGLVSSKIALTIAPSKTTYKKGEQFLIDINVKQPGVEHGKYKFSVILMSGNADVILDNNPISTTGAWCDFKNAYAQLVITPQATGVLLMSFQAQSSDGLLSEKQVLNISVEVGSDMSVSIDYVEKIINPTPTTLIPITFIASKDGYTGKFSVACKPIKGSGSLYYDDFVVNNSSFEFTQTASTYYKPTELGEQMFEFTISATGETITRIVYMDVVKNIVVTSNIDNNYYTVVNSGEHNIEGETIKLYIKNNRYNFRPTHWKNSTNQIISTDTLIEFKASIVCEPIYDVKLLNTVTLHKGQERTVEKVYYRELPPPIPLRPYYQYEGHTSIYTDYPVSDMVRFYYEESKYIGGGYDTPYLSQQRGYRYISLYPNSNWCGDFIKLGTDNWKIYLRQCDNTDLKFNKFEGYIESYTARYYFGDSGLITE